MADEGGGDNSAAKMNRRDRRRPAKIGAEAMAERDAQPEWVKANRPPGWRSVKLTIEDVR